MERSCLFGVFRGIHGSCSYQVWLSLCRLAHLAVYSQGISLTRSYPVATSNASDGYSNGGPSEKNAAPPRRSLTAPLNAAPASQSLTAPLDAAPTSQSRRTVAVLETLGSPWELLCDRSSKARATRQPSARHAADTRVDGLPL